MFGVVWDHYSSKLKGTEYKQNTSQKIKKTEIKILANPGLANRPLNNLVQVPNVQRLHNGIHWINRYPADKC